MTLLKSVLGRMLRDYADLALPNCTSLSDEPARSRLAARTHKLKGSAGMISEAIDNLDFAHAAGLLREAHPRSRPLSAATDA